MSQKSGYSLTGCICLKVFQATAVKQLAKGSQSIGLAVEKVDTSELTHMVQQASAPFHVILYTEPPLDMAAGFLQGMQSKREQERESGAKKAASECNLIEKGSPCF